MVAHEVMKANEVVKMIETLNFHGEFTKKEFDAIREKGSTTLDWLRTQGIKYNGQFGHANLDSKNFRPIVKLVRKEFFTTTLKNPITKRTVLTSDGKEIPNVKVDDILYNTTSKNLLEQISPNFRIETIMTNEIEVCRNYYEIDYDVVAEMIKWCEDNSPKVMAYYLKKLQKAKFELARLERIVSTF